MKYKSILFKLIPNIQTYYLQGQRVLKYIFVFLRYLPGSSKIFGPPRGIYINTDSYNKVFPKDSIREVLFKPESYLERTVQTTNSVFIHNKFKSLNKVRVYERKAFIIPNARYFYGYGGTVLTKDDKIFLPCSPLKNEFYPNRHQSLYLLKAPKLFKLNKVVLLDTLVSESNYCHWLRDHILRFFWLKKLNIDFSEYTLVSTIGDKSYHSYSLETLKAYGFNFKGLLSTKNIKHFECNELIVPPILTPAFNADYYSFLKEEWDFLRDIFVQKERICDNNKRIFISRRRSNRSSQDEDKLIEILENKYNFKEIFLEDLNISEQANLFNNAEIVVGLHGAGFTNLGFCKPHTLVFEIFSPDFIVTDFWDIANQMNLNYNAYCNDDSIKNIDSYRLAREEAITIDIQDFMSFFLSKSRC